MFLVEHQFIMFRVEHIYLFGWPTPIKTCHPAHDLSPCQGELLPQIRGLMKCPQQELHSVPRGTLPQIRLAPRFVIQILEVLVARPLATGVADATESTIQTQA
jgi:hypothetical protein